MFKISPIEEKARQEEVAKACGTVCRDGMFAYQMVDCESGALMGFSQFELTDGRGILYDLREIPEAKDTEAMFILGRATMSFIEKIGVTDCYAMEDAGDRRLLCLIGFRETGEGKPLFCNLAGMFDGHCGGHKVTL